MENVFHTHRWGLGMGLGHVMCKGGQLFFDKRGHQRKLATQGGVTKGSCSEVEAEEVATTMRS